MNNSSDRIDVLADGEHYVTPWYRGWGVKPDGTHAIMRARKLGLGGNATGGERVGSRPTLAEAEAERDRLNAEALARVQP